MSEKLAEIHPVLRDRVSTVSDEVRRMKAELADRQKTYEDLCSLQSAAKWEKVKLAELLRNADTQEKRILGQPTLDVVHFTGHMYTQIVLEVWG